MFRRLRKTRIIQAPESWAEFCDEPEYLDFQTAEKDYLELPLWLVDLMVDREYSDKISRSTEKLQQMAEHMRFNDYEPGVVVYGPTSCKLQDGNHRFIICKQRGDVVFKVKLTRSEKNISTQGLRFVDIFEKLIRGYNDS